MIIDLLRPLANAGVRPERFASILLELATKKHTLRAIEREEELRIARQLDPEKEGWQLAEFGDRLTYAGCVPSGKYFANVLNEYSRSMRDHMDAEVCATCNMSHSIDELCIACAYHVLIMCIACA